MADWTTAYWGDGSGTADFSPTPGEYFWATVTPRPHRIWSDRSGEPAFYFNINMTIACIEAYRKMGDTYTAYKWVRAAQLLPSVSSAVIRAAPTTLAVAAGVAVAGDTTESTASNLAVITGTPGSRPSKPWWMPLAVYYALYS